MHNRYLSQPHNRPWCTFFKLVFFLAKRTWNFCLFWPIRTILTRLYAFFGVLFTGMNSGVVYQNWQISGMSLWYVGGKILMFRKECEFFLSWEREGRGFPIKWWNEIEMVRDAFLAHRLGRVPQKLYFGVKWLREPTTRGAWLPTSVEIHPRPFQTKIIWLKQKKILNF